MQEELLAAARREAAAVQAAKAAPRLQQQLQVSLARLGLRDMMPHYSRWPRRTGLFCVYLKVCMTHDQSLQSCPSLASHLTEPPDLLNPGLQRQEQRQKLELCLEALGERAERIAALEADMAETRAVFRGALGEAVGQLAEARAAAAAATAAAAAAAAAAQPQRADAPGAASSGM